MPLDLIDLTQVTEDYLKISGLRSEVLQPPCYSDEDILCKQVICVPLIMCILSWHFVNFVSWDTDDDRFAVAVRNLAIHGASVCGFTASTSNRFARYEATLLRRATATPNNGFLWRHHRSISLEALAPHLAPSAIFALQRLPMSPNVHGTWGIAHLLALEPISMSPETIGVPYFWIALQGIGLLNCPVTRDSFHCGALPHVEALETVPLSDQDQRLHDGPTCQCRHIELAAAQRTMSVADLIISPNTVQSLQSRCRSIIINSCQGHGAVPAIKHLPLPGPMIEYL